jgi:hypothetical protein
MAQLSVEMVVLLVSILPLVFGQWKTLPSVPDSLGEVAAGYINGKLYMVGQGTSKTYVYDPLSQSWNSGLSQRPKAGNHHAAVTPSDGKLWLVGGLSGGEGLVSMNSFTLLFTFLVKISLGLFFRSKSSLQVRIHGVRLLCRVALADRCAPLSPTTSCTFVEVSLGVEPPTSVASIPCKPVLSAP